MKTINNTSNYLAKVASYIGAIGFLICMYKLVTLGFFAEFLLSGAIFCSSGFLISIIIPYYPKSIKDSPKESSKAQINK